MAEYLSPLKRYSPAVPDVLKELDRTIERISEESHVWEIQFFKPGGKWKYTDYVVMTKPEGWVDFDILIQTALDNTPMTIRQTSIKSIEDWTVVMVNNPLGFPIMVVGKEPT
jgi:hypothetical protein